MELDQLRLLRKALYLKKSILSRQERLNSILDQFDADTRYQYDLTLELSEHNDEHLDQIHYLNNSMQQLRSDITLILEQELERKKKWSEELEGLMNNKRKEKEQLDRVTLAVKESSNLQVERNRPFTGWEEPDWREFIQRQANEKELEQFQSVINDLDETKRVLHCKRQKIESELEQIHQSIQQVLEDNDNYPELNILQNIEENMIDKLQEVSNDAKKTEDRLENLVSQLKDRQENVIGKVETINKASEA
jgi:chromosome segregation ATPase